MAHDELYKAFGRTVAKRRDALGLTQMDLAGKTGLSRASVASIESGRQNVLLHQVYVLSEALELDRVSDLLPAKPRLESEAVKISDESVTPRSKAQITSMVEAALARRLPRAES